MSPLTLPQTFPTPGQVFPAGERDGVAVPAQGIYAGITTAPDGAIYALMLLAEEPESDLTWQAATAWAASLGASLPTRQEGALLFANVKPHFRTTWHWLSEEMGGSFAWDQGFLNGGQGSSHKSFEGRARAVRRLPLESFIALLGVAA